MQVIFIEATNPGNRTVPNDLQVPRELNEGKACQTWLSLPDLIAGLTEEGLSGKVRLVGYFNDAVGTRYRSKP